MRHRRVTRTLGAAAGGLVAGAYLPAAAAFADDYTVGPAPGSTETITGIYGYGFDGVDTASPATPGSIQGDQEFTYTDTTSGHTGAFEGDESNATDAFGDTNQEVLVTSDLSGTDAPPVGSVFDTYTVGDSGYSNIYSAIPTGDGDYEITDTVVTPDGDYTIPTTFNAADLPIADAGGVPEGNGADIDPVGSQVITAITGISPLAMAYQGTQTFDVDNASGTAAEGNPATWVTSGEMYE